jgi:hypothetical protein
VAHKGGLEEQCAKRKGEEGYEAGYEAISGDQELLVPARGFSTNKLQGHNTDLKSPPYEKLPDLLFFASSSRPHDCLTTGSFAGAMR